MKRTFGLFLCLLIVGAAILPFALAESAPDPAGGSVVQTVVPEIDVGEPLTWTYLATIAGAAALTLLIVQFFKVPLDRVWKIPTKVFAYIVSLIIMLVATAFTTGLSADNVLLVASNAFLAAVAAYGAYEVSFKRLDTNSNSSIY